MAQINPQNSLSINKRWLPTIILTALFLLISFLLIYKLDKWPSLWWDEGWTLDAARNWITQGHLGHYLDGGPVPPRIPLRFPIVIPVAISMKLFGVGTWQGRLPGVIFTLLSLGLIGHLASTIFTRKTGVATLIIIFCFSVFIYHPLNLGRQVMAEMPMMFYLLGGFFFIWLALSKSPIWGVGAALLFGVGIHAKLQVPPFWLCSIIIAIWVSISLHQRRTTRTLLGITAGSITVAVIVLFVQNRIMPGSFTGSELIKLLFNTVIFVPIGVIRVSAMKQVLLFGAPLLLSFIWAGWRTWGYLSFGKRSKIKLLDPIESDIVIIMSALWGLGASWFFWYSVMAIDWIRYMFPPFFIGSIFIAGYLGELTKCFDLRLLVKQTSSLLLGREVNFINLQTLILFIALGINLGAAFLSAEIGLTLPRYDPELASTYLRNNIPTGARVETFESELFFLAPDIKYHFPSDLVSMQAQRKTTIDPTFKIDYDPLEAKPDYIVIGGMGHLWPIYEDTLAQGQFHLEADIGNYQIYRFQKPLINR